MRVTEQRYTAVLAGNRSFQMQNAELRPACGAAHVRQATFNQEEIPNGPILLRERQVNSVRIDAPRDAQNKNTSSPSTRELVPLIPV